MAETVAEAIARARRQTARKLRKAAKKRKARGATAMTQATWRDVQAMDRSFRESAV